MLSSFWFLKSKFLSSTSEYIVELTSDGVAYVWPVKAQISEVAHMKKWGDQDIESLLIDGDFIETNGFYHGIVDFIRHSRFNEDLFDYYPIGQFNSIRSCRHALSK